jgi:hypothetical protein
MKLIAKKTGPVKRSKSIKVRLDYRTIIVLKSLSALKTWRKRYPKAVVMAA